MSTIFNSYDSVARYIPNTGAIEVIGAIGPQTTPEEFEQLCKTYPQFELGHCNTIARTTLHVAAKAGNVSLIKYIIERAPQLLERGHYDGDTPLLSAVFAHKPEAVQTLLESGANPNIITETGHPNIITGEIDILTISILDVAARLFKKSHNDNSDALKKAELSQIVKLLVKQGAELYPVDEQSYYEVRLRPYINPAVQEASREVAQEQRQISEMVYKNIPLPQELCNIIGSYS